MFTARKRNKQIKARLDKLTQPPKLVLPKTTQQTMTFRQRQAVWDQVWAGHDN